MESLFYRQHVRVIPGPDYGTDPQKSHIRFEVKPEVIDGIAAYKFEDIQQAGDYYSLISRKNNQWLLFHGMDETGIRLFVPDLQKVFMADLDGDGDKDLLLIGGLQAIEVLNMESERTSQSVEKEFYDKIRAEIIKDPKASLGEKIAAARMMGSSADPEAVSSLVVKAYEQKNWPLALEALTILWGRGVFETYCTQIVEDNTIDASFRIRAAEYLKRTGHQEKAKSMLSRLAKDNNLSYDSRRWAVGELGWDISAETPKDVRREYETLRDDVHWEQAHDPKVEVQDRISAAESMRDPERRVKALFDLARDKNVSMSMKIQVLNDCGLNQQRYVGEMLTICHDLLQGNSFSTKEEALLRETMKNITLGEISERCDTF